MTYACISSQVVSKFVPRAEQSNVQFTVHSAKYGVFFKKEQNRWMQVNQLSHWDSEK